MSLKSVYENCIVYRILCFSVAEGGVGKKLWRGDPPSTITWGVIYYITILYITILYITINIKEKKNAGRRQIFNVERLVQAFAPASLITVSNRARLRTK